MNYEKKYNEALYWMKSLYPGLHGVTKEEAEKYFPELKELKGERVKQSIIADIKSKMKSCTHTLDDYYREQIAWLEKQESLKDIIDRYKDSWYNEGKIAGMAEGLTDDEKYQQGWHDALEKACEWLKDKLDYCEIECYDEKKFINDFKEAMEGDENENNT